MQQISVAISFHTPGELILWPYSYTYEDVPEDMRPDDQAVLWAMGQAMAATNGYRPQQFSDMYIASGEFTDWAYGVHRIFAYTFEMSNNRLPGPLIPEQTARNRGAVLYLLEQADCPYDVIGAGAAHCTDRINEPWRMWLPVVSCLNAVTAERAEVSVIGVVLRPWAKKRQYNGVCQRNAS